MGTLLVLGGTAWLGAEVACQGLERGMEVTCLARGESGASPDGVRWVAADRRDPAAYDALASTDWDAVVDVSWQPAMVAGAVAALGPRAAHWTCVSSISVYADGPSGRDETATRHAPLMADEATVEEYGGAKARCEDLVIEGLGERALLARAGLISGPGDHTDRYGYWVSRMALAPAGPVLAPLPGTTPVQVVDVRDLAAWILAAGEQRTTGPVNAVGAAVPLADVLATAAEVAGFTGDLVWAEPEWLTGEGVTPWMGPHSLPLWTGEADGYWFSDARARETGLLPRALPDMLADILGDERIRGLDRERHAGLSRREEEALLARLG